MTMATPEYINLVTPSTAPTSPASLGTDESGWSSEEMSPGDTPYGIWLGGHYNPTENWMLWTNRSYEPRRAYGRVRQMLRQARSDASYFGY